MKKELLLSTVAGVVAVAGSAHAGDHKMEKEKCYGVVKAGKNDCGAKDGSHACAGMSKVDGDSNEWVMVPKGLCHKLAGGKLAGDK